IPVFPLAFPWAFLPLSTFVLTAVFLRSFRFFPIILDASRCSSVLPTLSVLSILSRLISCCGTRDIERGGEDKAWYAQLQTAAVHMLR
ncbi:MAG: hypothetical protein ACOYEQ_10480, partial [Bacillota bacterium]